MPRRSLSAAQLQPVIGHRCTAPNRLNAGRNVYIRYVVSEATTGSTRLCISPNRSIRSSRIFRASCSEET